MSQLRDSRVEITNIHVEIHSSAHTRIDECINKYSQRNEWINTSVRYTVAKTSKVYALTEVSPYAKHRHPCPVPLPEHWQRFEQRVYLYMRMKVDLKPVLMLFVWSNVFNCVVVAKIFCWSTASKIHVPRATSNMHVLVQIWIRMWLMDLRHWVWDNLHVHVRAVANISKEFCNCSAQRFWEQEVDQAQTQREDVPSRYASYPPKPLGNKNTRILIYVNLRPVCICINA